MPLNSVASAGTAGRRFVHLKRWTERREPAGLAQANYVPGWKVRFVGPHNDLWYVFAITLRSWLVVFQQDDTAASRGSSGTGTVQRADNAGVRNRGVNQGVTNGSLVRDTGSSDEGICGVEGRE